MSNWKLLALCFLFSVSICSLIYLPQVKADTTELTVTIDQAITFAVTTSGFGTLVPGTYKIATSTLAVDTNDTTGWNVTLYGNDQGDADTVLDLTTDASVGIPDQTEWVPGAATSSAGNAVVRGSLDSSGKVLAFRVMTASGTPAFFASEWWGANDDDGTAKWAGIASSTVARQIGRSGAGSYSASTHLNTVQYYLDVAASQPAGAYDGILTFTATTNS